VIRREQVIATSHVLVERLNQGNHSIMTCSKAIHLVPQRASLFSLIPLPLRSHALLLRFGLVLDLRGNALEIERLELERPLQRDGLGHVTLSVVASLIVQRTFEDHLPALI